MRCQKAGFTIVELVLVLVVIGLLSAVAIPRYIQYSEQQRKAENLEVVGFVRNALALARADKQDFPSVAALAQYVHAHRVDVKSSAVVVLYNGERFLVPTYLDINCSTPTQNIKDVVRCVGNIP